MTRDQLPALFLATLVLFAAAACGGSGGGSGAPAAPSDLVYPAAAPTYTACLAATPNVPTVTGTVDAWQVDPALPPGLVLDAVTGTISGTPSATAAPTVHTVTASGPGGATDFDLTVEVVAPPAPAALSYPGAYATALVDVVVELEPEVSGAPTQWSVTPPLPAGLDLDALTGVISGAPDAVAASATYTVTAEDCLGALTTFDLEFEVLEPGDLVTPRFVHAASADGTVTVFGVRANGQLRSLGYDLVGADPMDLETSWTTRHLVVLSADPGALETYSVDPLHGRLSLEPVASAALPAGALPRRVLVDELHRVAWVTLGAADAVAGFALGGDGSLTPLAGSPYALAGVGPTGLALSADGTRLLVSNTTSGTVSVLTLGGDGVPVDQVAHSVGALPGDLAVLAGGGDSLVWIAENGADAIGIYTLSGVALAAQGAVPLGAGASPITLAAGIVGGVARVWALADVPAGDVLVFGADTVSGALSGPTVADTNGPDGDGAPLDFVVSRDLTRAYALLGASGEIAGMTMDGSGLLAPVQPGSAPTNRMRARPEPRRLALGHGTGPFEFESDALYTANRGSADLSQFAFDPVTAQLDALVPPEEPTDPAPNGLVVHPRLDVLYVSHDLGTFSAEPVRRYALATDGVATLLDGYDPGLTFGGYHALAMDPSARFLTASARIESTLHVLTVDPSGAVELADTAPAGVLPVGMAMTPNGAFVYVASNGDAVVHGFAVDPASGVLSAVPGSPFAVSIGPLSVAIDSSGRFLYVPCSEADVLHAFTIDAADGSLNELTASPFATGLDPEHAAVDPTGRYVYVACRNTQAIFVYRVNLTAGNAFQDGTLTAPATVAVTGTPVHLVFDPSGEHLFATLSGGEVLTFEMDPDTGTIASADSDPAGTNARTSAPRARPR